MFMVWLMMLSGGQVSAVDNYIVIVVVDMLEQAILRIGWLGDGSE